jgi:hypothetical protein
MWGKMAKREWKSGRLSSRKLRAIKNRVDFVLESTTKQKSKMPSLAG